MYEHIIVIVVSILLLAGLAVVFIYFIFKSSKAEVDEYYNVLLQKLGTRLDKIPNLIETARPHLTGHDALLADIVALRAKIWTVSALKERVHLELEISGLLHQIWELAAKSDELMHNTNFLELKMEFKEISAEIDDMSEKYNAKVRNYNSRADFFILAPVLKLMRFGRMKIFEFER